MTFYAIKRTPADKWFSYIVRFRDNFTCQICGTKDYARANNMPAALEPGPSKIECAHLFSRAGIYSATRHDRENAVSLCHRCHDLMTHDESNWRRWCQNRLGTRYDTLALKSRQTNHGLKYVIKEFTEQLKKEVIQTALKTDRIWIIEKDLLKKDMALL